MPKPIEKDWKARNRHLQILEKAERGQYGVLAAIAYNVEQIHGLFQAAKEARSPLILQFFPWAVTFADGILVRTAAEAIKQYDVPVSIHLDHAQDEDVIRHAADNLPFDSIMVDMSHYEKSENLGKTAKWVRYCHERDLLGSMTTPEEVHDFQTTGVDCLAPAIGNIHGEYGSAGPSLDFDRLENVRKLLDGKTRIALHGTNGFPADLMKQCIAAGVSKVNVNKLVLDDYYDHLKQNVGKVPHTVLMEQGVEKVKALTMEWMTICGSASQA